MGAAVELVWCHRMAALFVVDRLKSEVITSAITHYQHVAVRQARRHIIKRIINRHKVKKPDDRKVSKHSHACKEAELELLDTVLPVWALCYVAITCIFAACSLFSEGQQEMFCVPECHNVMHITCNNV